MKIRDRLVALSLAVVATILALAPAHAVASDRVIVYPLENPPSTLISQQQRDDRLTIGNFLRDLLGPSNLGGVYANLTIAAAGGMNVQVQPTTTGSQGTIYQMIANDANPIPIGYSPQLPADPTTIMVEGQQTGASSALGPMSAPGTSGQSVYYLVEAQLQAMDITPVSELFLNTAGGKTYSTVNTVRRDVIVYQLKQGTAAVSPTIPTTDTGWIAIGNILIPFGTSTITSGMISPAPPFGGFTTATNTVTLFPAPNPTPSQVGSTAINGTSQVGSLAVGPTPAPTTSGQAQITMSLGVATPAPTATGQVAVNGTLGVGVAPPIAGSASSIGASGAIRAGASTAAGVTSGDLAASRNATCGALNLGGTTSSAQLDFGCTTSGVTTLNQPFVAPNLVPTEPGGRLTLTSGAPVMPATVSNTTSVYYTPFVAALVPIFNGTSWIEYSFSQESLTLTSSHSASGLYDIFQINNAGTLVICTGPAWSSFTSRGTGAGTTQISQLNGIWVNTNAFSSNCWNNTTSYSASANQATYLGTIQTNASGQTSMEFDLGGSAGGSNNHLWVYNAYRRVPTIAVERDSNSLATTSSTSFSQTGAADQINITDGLQQSFGMAEVHALAAFQSSGAAFGFLGIGINSTTSSFPGCQNQSFYIMSSTNVNAPLGCTTAWMPQLGRYYIASIFAAGSSASFGIDLSSNFSLTVTIPM